MFGWDRKQVNGVEIGHQGKRRNARRRPLGLESLEGRISLSAIGADMGHVAAQVLIQAGGAGDFSSQPGWTRQNPNACHPGA